MHLSWFHRIDATWITLALICGMIGFAEIGYLIGARRHDIVGDKGRGYFGTVLGSMLGLMALLLGFTFHLSSQRYETRSQLVIEHANALNAVYLQTGMLPETQRKQLKAQLRAYIDAINSIPKREMADTRQVDLSHIEAIYRGMWESVRKMVQATPPVAGSEPLVGMLNQAEALSRFRFFSYTGRVPDMIVWLLLCAASVAMGAVGFASGLSRYRGWMARITLTMIVAATIFIILNLDQPRGGFMPIDQSPMTLLQHTIDSDPEAAQ